MNDNLIYVESQFFEDSETEKAKQFKKMFPNAVVKKFVLAHDGNVFSKVVGYGQKLFNFSKEIIHNMASKIKKGIQVIKGHSIDNENVTNKTVGEIIDVSVENKNGKTYILGLVGFYDKKDSDYDSISAEMRVGFSDYIVNSIADIFRFAVGSTKNGDLPAFPGAKEIGVVHCFFNEGSKENIDENKNLLTKDKKMEEITFTQVKEFIRKHNVFPTQIWTVQEIIGIPKNENGEIVFVNGVDDRISNYLAKSIPDMKTYETKIKQLEQEREDLLKIKNEFQELNKKQKIDNFKAIVLKKADDKKLSEKLKKYLTKKLDRYNSDIADFETESESFIKEASDEFQDLFSGVVENPPVVNKFPSEGEPSEKTKPVFEDQF